MDVQRLRQAVEEEFAATGAATPPWRDPHPDGAAPLDEEYSRCLNPGKYRILSTRTAAWARALNRLGLAAVEEVENHLAAWRETPVEPLDTTTKLRPARADAVPLVLGTRRLDGVPGTIVTLGAGEPAVELTTLPDCGCDACDSGSEALLEELDEYVLAVVTGDLVHVTRGPGTLVATGSGWSASDWPETEPIETALAKARDGHSPHHVVQGPTWL
ncbi:DUF6226 family protein [Streptomyces pathocidini]|uniref:DUF6226 family protein n=1 Tax=Streptomyces pathocidini TaxID=1650571 RepID=A0ABW7UXI9_9ACTN|nr:DUF6226 family protein [Streptomyces pathocidini]